MMKRIIGYVMMSLCAAMTFAQGNVQTDKPYGYLYCHMSDEGEWTAYALSRDGKVFHDLLDVIAGKDLIHSFLLKLWCKHTHYRYYDQSCYHCNCSCIDR